MASSARRKVWRLRTAVLIVGLVVTTQGMVAPVAASAETPTGASVASEALFEGEIIDLSEDWGEATACLIWNQRGVRECFRTEAELDARVAELGGPAPSKDEMSYTMASCSSSVKLYDGVYYAGNVVYLADRWSWINLSSYGFSTKTSSFKIGACSSYFADYSSGGGSWYPTSGTQAWDVASVMVSGWSNRVSSVYIT